MCQVNMYQAKTEFSKLVAMLERKEEDEVLICRDGVPVAKMVKFNTHNRKGKFGCARQKLNLPDNFYEEFQALDKVVQEMFGL